MIPDRQDLYEACVQSPPEMAAMLRAIHGRQPKALGEDFAGSAALSRHWVRAVPGGSAVAVDLDATALARAEGTPGVRTVSGDVRTVSDLVDCLFVGNFSIGYLHTRAELLDYLRHARSRLRPGGVFVCDTYGGNPRSSRAASTATSRSRAGSSASTAGSSARPTRSRAW